MKTSVRQIDVRLIYSMFLKIPSYIGLTLLLLVAVFMVSCSPDASESSASQDSVTLSFFSETYAASMESYTLQSEQASLFFSIGDLVVDESGKFLVVLKETELTHEVFFPGNSGTVPSKMVISEAEVEGSYSSKTMKGKGTFLAKYTLTGVENNLDAVVEMTIEGTVAIGPTEYDAHKGRLEIWFEGESARVISIGEKTLEVSDDNYSAAFIYSIHE